MNTKQICKQCEAPLPADAPQGICPQCLMKAGLGTQGQTIVISMEAATGSPSLEEVARHFPQLEILGLLGRGGMGTGLPPQSVQRRYQNRQPDLDHSCGGSDGWTPGLNAASVASVLVEGHAFRQPRRGA
jgi:hypothetical protein